MTIALNTFNAGMTDYIAKHNENYAAIKNAIDQIQAVTQSQAAGLAVPLGLQQIFDRKGLIGISSYDFTEGLLQGPDYNLVISAGGYWSGSAYAYNLNTTTISLKTKGTGAYYLNVDSAGTPALSSGASSTDTVRQFYWDAGAHSVSQKALYQNIEILFDGDDYHACLHSAALSMTFTRLADRLEEIEARSMEMGRFLSYDSSQSNGLNFYYRSGRIRNDAVIWEVEAGHVALENGAVNYLEVDPADGSVSTNITSFTSGNIPLYAVVTASGAITTVTDNRTWAFVGGGGGSGGGHTQNTDTGTTSPEFKLLLGKTGAPTLNAALKVERGDSPDVSVRWNEALDRWQYTNDGSTWKNMADYSDLNLGGQEIAKYIGKDNPDKVLELYAIGTSPAYTDLDLSSYITSLQGASAVVLRIFFWDSAPGSDINVKFKNKGSGAVPAEAFTVWSGSQSPATLVVPIGTSKSLQYFVSASGAGAANLKIYLLGYMAKVLGIGTQERLFADSIEVPAGSSVTTAFAGQGNRGMANYLKVEVTGSPEPTGNFDIMFYSSNSYADTDLLYKAVEIAAGTPYEDFEPWWLRDKTSNSKLYVKLVNHDSVYAATYNITLGYEQFA